MIRMKFCKVLHADKKSFHVGNLCIGKDGSWANM